MSKDVAPRNSSELEVFIDGEHCLHARSKEQQIARIACSPVRKPTSHQRDPYLRATHLIQDEEAEQPFYA